MISVDASPALLASSPVADRSKRQRAVIHIGLNKTGSSTRHAWLAMNRDALQRLGIWFDDLGPHGGPRISTALGWSMYAHSIRPAWLGGTWERQVYRIKTRADLEARIAEFLRRAEASFPPADHGTYVTSAEAIGSGIKTVPEVQRLHSWFKERFLTVDYIMYIRDPVDWVPSAWVQSVRAGQTMTLDQFIARHGGMELYEIVRRWHVVAGADRLAVRVLHADQLRNRDLIDDFAHLVGIDPAPLQRPARRNESMSAARLAVTLWISRNFGPALRKIGLGPVERRLYSMPIPWAKRLRGIRLSTEQAARIREMNAESNEKLRKLFFPDRSTLFESHMNPARI